MFRFETAPLPGLRATHTAPIGREMDVQPPAKGLVFPCVIGPPIVTLPPLSTALADAVAHGAVAPIGPDVAAVNPASQTPDLLFGGPGDVYGRGFMPGREAVSDDELRGNASSVLGAVRVMAGGGGQAPSWLPQGQQVPPPRLILPGDLGRWPATPNAFPVFVTYPGFGGGLAVRYLNLETSTGVPAGLYYAVKKMTPLGPVPSEPFSLGFYAVPSWMIQRVPLAVVQMFPAENVVVVDDYRGNQFSVDYVTFRSTNDPRYELARRILVLQYPYLMSDMLSTRLLTEPPPDMKPGGALPPRLTQMPAVLVPPSK